VSGWLHTLAALPPVRYHSSYSHGQLLFTIQGKLQASTKYLQECIQQLYAGNVSYIIILLHTDTEYCFQLQINCILNRPFY